MPLSVGDSGVSTRGHSLKLQKRDCKSVLRANVLGYRIVNLWNSLPEDIVSAPTVNSLKGDDLTVTVCIYVTVITVQTSNFKDQSTGLLAYPWLHHMMITIFDIWHSQCNLHITAIKPLQSVGQKNRLNQMNFNNLHINIFSINCKRNYSTIQLLTLTRSRTIIGEPNRRISSLKCCPATCAYGSAWSTVQHTQSNMFDFCLTGQSFCTYCWSCTF